MIQSALCNFQFAIRNSQFAIALALLLSPVLSLPSPCPAQDDPFAAGVRTTPWLSPADEQKAFKLPPGFAINLVAAEPDIQKPLNMAFDERGRIWLTCTVEYPYAAPPDRPGRDSIRVLEDADGDGRFEKVTTFADGLNIPIGIYPYKGGCIAYSIPNIWHFEDTNGDGTCDKRTVLYGPFDYSRDTHGMVNSFRRGFDGWIYACHGFNNDSRVKGQDGHEVHMQSGNTFRFKIDGSQIEHFTHGQVNPFGMCFDELFNIFTADCHSKPLTQLLRGGYYPSFGKPHDGLGFVPSMMEHSHGSTAICGVAIYTGETFPPEYRGLFYSGNVMTSRINCNKPQYHGSTIKAIEQPDFLTTSDPWFRPVDIHIGPEGAMYILDFYNRIIGHYEVPLPHPGRDRTSGRIWRVAYKVDAAGGAVGNALRGVPGGGTDLTKLTISQLIDQLDSPQLEHRLRVLNYLLDSREKDCIPLAVDTLATPRTSRQLVGALWILERLGQFKQAEFQTLAAHADRAVRVHALHAWGERYGSSDEERRSAQARLTDADAFVQRAAARGLGEHPDFSEFHSLVSHLTKVPREDALLRHGIRIAMLRYLGSFNEGEGMSIIPNDPRHRDETYLAEVLSVATSANSSGATTFLLDYLGSHSNGPAFLAIDFERMSRQIPAAALPRLIEVCKRNSDEDPALQARLVRSLANGISQRSGVSAEPLVPWATNIATHLLAVRDSESLPWQAVPTEGLPPSENPWGIAARPSRDGDSESLFFYSLPKGEQRTGIYRSGAFELPAKLSFWCAGHSGFPGKPLNDGNYVRLRDAKTHEILAESRPPRNDTARRFEWDLTKYTSEESRPSPQPSPKGRGGRQAYIELVDGDMANAYAWLAVGRFSLSSLNPDQAAGRQRLAAEIIGKLKLAALKPQLTSLVRAATTEAAARAAIAQALVALKPDARAAALAAALGDPLLPPALQLKIGAAIERDVHDTYVECLRDVMKQAPTRLQAQMADALAGDTSGAAALISLIESGHAAPRLLLLPNVKNKLAALGSANLDGCVAKITAALPPASETIDRALIERRAAFAKAAPNLERGLAVFTKHCAGCHQVAGKGALVGPQLDGIGSRGLDRLLEDTLDPNRNVDVAFRTTTIRTKDGQVLTGLVRREEGPQLVLADAQGKEFTVARSEMDAQQKTALSLMPANVAEVVTADEFTDLLGYLLAQRSANPTTAQ
jgi:putative heme-binding domain-containing protein